MCFLTLLLDLEFINKGSLQSNVVLQRPHFELLAIGQFSYVTALLCHLAHAVISEELVKLLKLSF